MSHAKPQMLYTTLALLGCLLTGTGVTANPEEPKMDDMDTLSLRLAGEKAVECGRVPVRGKPDEATKCVFQAFSHKKAFRVRYDQQGFDSAVAYGMAGTPDGRVFEIRFDGNVAGGGRTTPGLERTDARPCPKPVILKTSRDGFATCAGSDP